MPMDLDREYLDFNLTMSSILDKAQEYAPNSETSFGIIFIFYHLYLL